MDSFLAVAVRIPGKKAGERIGLVKFYETGYYPCFLDLPDWTVEQVDECVHEFNESRGIPDDVAESAMGGSMFGWHVPAAQRAIEFFKQRA
jgi:hypothetical protein